MKTYPQMRMKKNRGGGHTVTWHKNLKCVKGYTLRTPTVPHPLQITTSSSFCRASEQTRSEDSISRHSHGKGRALNTQLSSPPTLPFTTQPRHVPVYQYVEKLFSLNICIIFHGVDTPWFFKKTHLLDGYWGCFQKFRNKQFCNKETCKFTCTAHTELHVSVELRSSKLRLLD